MPRLFALLCIALFVSFLPACSHTGTSPAPTVDPTVTAIEVLRGAATVAGSRDLVAGVLVGLRVPGDWLRSGDACIAAEVVRQVSLEAVRDLEATPTGPVILGGELDLRSCDRGEIAKPLGPGAWLVASGVIDTIQGWLLIAHVPEHDPRGYGVGCGVLEWLRTAGPAALAEASASADGRVTWETQSLDGIACRSEVLARAGELVAAPVIP